jgi:hypothetical protein
LRNKNYLQQLLLASLKQNPLSTRPALPTKKPASQGYAINIYDADEVNTITQTGVLGTVVRDGDVTNTGAGNEGLEPLTLTNSEIRASLQAPLVRRASLSNVNNSASPFKFFISSTLCSLVPPRLSKSDFCVFKKNDATENTVHSYYSLNGINSLSLSSSEKPYHVTATKPALRISLYHMDADAINKILVALLSQQAKGGSLTPTLVLRKLVGYLDGTQRYTEECCDTLYGRKENAYSLKELIILLINAKFHEVSCDDNLVQSWDQTCLDLTTLVNLHEALTHMQPKKSCTIL